MDNTLDHLLTVEASLPSTLVEICRDILDDGNVLSFNLLLPAPVDNETTTDIDTASEPSIQDAAVTSIKLSVSDKPTKIKEVLDLAKVNKNTSWEESNWGTISNASESSILTKDDDNITISFQTVNKPPTLWLKALSEKYPDSDFMLASLSFMEDRAGDVLYNAGIAVDFNRHNPIILADISSLGRNDAWAKERLIEEKSKAAAIKQKAMDIKQKAWRDKNNAKSALEASRIAKSREIVDYAFDGLSKSDKAMLWAEKKAQRDAQEAANIAINKEIIDKAFDQPTKADRFEAAVAENRKKRAAEKLMAARIDEILEGKALYKTSPLTINPISNNQSYSTNKDYISEALSVVAMLDSISIQGRPPGQDFSPKAVLANILDEKAKLHERATALQEEVFDAQERNANLEMQITFLEMQAQSKNTPKIVAPRIPSIEPYEDEIIQHKTDLEYSQMLLDSLLYQKSINMFNSGEGQLEFLASQQHLKSEISKYSHDIALAEKCIQDILKKAEIIVP